MIETKKGHTKVGGTGVELLADLTCIVKNIYIVMTENGNAFNGTTESLIFDAVNYGISIGIKEMDKDGK